MVEKNVKEKLDQKAEKNKMSVRSTKKISFWQKPIFVGEEKEYLIDNLAVLLRAGMNVVSALKAITQDIRSKPLKKVIVNMAEAIDEGEPIWRAMSEAQLFSPQILSLVRLGEESGRLVENLQVVALQRQKDRLFKSKIFSALLYPVLVLSLSGVIGIWVLFYLLPQLAETFSSLNIALPIFTKILLAIGVFIQNYGSIVVPVFAVLATFFIVILFFVPKTKFVGDFILFHIPGIGKLLKGSEIGRMGYLMGTLIGAGVTLVDSVKSMSTSTSFKSYAVFYKFLAEQIDEGRTFQQSFEFFKKTNRFIPVPMQQLITSSEQSGHLAESFLGIGELYENRTDLLAKNLTVVLEPILLVFVGVGVLILALAVIMPIYGLIGGIA